MYCLHLSGKWYQIQAKKLTTGPPEYEMRRIFLEDLLGAKMPRSIVFVKATDKANGEQFNVDIKSRVRN